MADGTDRHERLQKPVIFRYYREITRVGLLLGLGIAWASICCERPDNHAAKESVAPSTSVGTVAEAPSTAMPVPATSNRGVPGEDHGFEATVRAANRLAPAQGASMTLHEPDWDAPQALSYTALKRLFRGYKNDTAHPSADMAALHGRAVTLSGAVMPLDPPGEDGLLPRFWLANPTVVMAGCVFCNPPTLADLVYVNTVGSPLKVDRETLYRGVVAVKLLGRFFIEPTRRDDGVEYLYRLELKRTLD